MHARFKEEIYNIVGMVLMMHLQMSNYIIVSMVQLNGDDMHWMLLKNDFDKHDAERLAADPTVMQITMQQRDGRR